MSVRHQLAVAPESEASSKVRRPQTAGMTLEHIVDAAGFEMLRDEWEELLASSSAGDNPFLTWEWLFTWWKHFGKGRRLLLLAMRERGKLAGLAPLCLGRRRLARGVRFPVVEFLGNGNVGSDYLDVIARHGFEHGVVRAAARYLAGEGEVVRLSYVRRDGTAAARIGHELRRLGWRLAESKTTVCPYIPLAGHTWESYLASLSREHRYAVRRKIRAVERGHHVRLEEARTEDQRREALRILVDLHLKRRNGLGGSDGFHTPELVAFHEEFTRLALARGWLRLFVLFLDDVPAGALYGLRYARTFFFYQSGFDPAFTRESPGVICMAMAIRRAIEEGAEWYDLLRGAEAYKLHWAREVHPLARFELFPPRWRGKMWRHALSIGRSVRRLRACGGPPPDRRHGRLTR